RRFLGMGPGTPVRDVRRAALLCGIVAVGAGALGARSVTNLAADPGAVGVLAIVLAGFALAVACFHLLRLGAAHRLAAGAVPAEEMAKLRLRPPLTGFGLSMIGPLLLHEGSEELKRVHLPSIVRGEIRWCQGYSEPGAGSDLASLQTRAVRDGDDYILNGQKIWTSYGDKADWMFVLVRTDFEGAKHGGITFLLMDMETPGVTVRPIRLI